MPSAESGATPFRPSDEDIRAYLEGEHGPPSPEAVRIIQNELERAVRPIPPAAKGVRVCGTCGHGMTDQEREDYVDQCEPCVIPPAKSEETK